MLDAVAQRASNAPPFFIVGVQRSGTTLLRLLLNAHSEVAIPEEARFLTPLLQRGSEKVYKGQEKAALVSYLAQDPQLALWNFNPSDALQHLAGMPEVRLREVMTSLYGEYTRAEGKVRWGDKSLFFAWISELEKMFPDAKFIHITRDGRDVYLSWRRMDSSMSNAAVVGLDWSYKEQKIRQSLAAIGDDNKFHVRYEDLLERPREVLQEITSFIGVKFEPSMLEFHKSSSQYIGRHHSTRIFGAIDPSNVRKWPKSLSARECAAFELTSRRSLERYGYERDARPTSRTDWLWSVGQLVRGLPRRVSTVLLNRRRYQRALSHGDATSGIAVGTKPRVDQ